MVLYPFVYLATGFALPPLRLQPTEVSSAHWVPVRALLDPALRTYERADVADRLARQRSGPVKVLLRWTLGRIMYAAVRLLPSESSFGPTAAPSVTLASNGQSPLTSLVASLGYFKSDDAIEIRFPERRLLLWGLTHGIVADLLDLMPSQTRLDWWFWPTLSAPDVRLIPWLSSYRFRRQKSGLILRSDANALPPVTEDSDASQQVSSTFDENSIACQTSHIQEAARHSMAAQQRRSRTTAHSAVSYLLDGYFQEIQKAVFITIGLRLGFLLAFAVFIAMRTRK